MALQGYQITVELSAEDRTFFETERKRLYPAHANRMPAHLTLIYFIQFKSAQQLNELPALLPPSFDIAVTDIMPLKYGAAYAVHSETLLALHKTLLAKFGEEASQRDTQDYIPHITVCNQVTAYKAQRIYQELKENFKPFTVRASGLVLKNKDTRPIFLPFDV